MMDILPSRSGEEPVLLGYGGLMRAELATVIGAYAQTRQAGLPLAERQQLVRDATGLRGEHADELTRYLEAEFEGHPQGQVLSVFGRTENMRKMLQGLGGPGRTEDDPVYWVKKAAVAALTHRHRHPGRLRGTRPPSQRTSGPARVIDREYSWHHRFQLPGEIQVCLVNLDPRHPIMLNRGDRIAQLVIQPVSTAVLTEVDSLPSSPRGDGGFGSTGGFDARRPEPGAG